MHHDFTPEEMQIMAYIWPYMLSPAEIAAAERKRQWDAMSEADRAKCVAVDRSARFA